MTFPQHRRIHAMQKEEKEVSKLIETHAKKYVWRRRCADINFVTFSKCVQNRLRAIKMQKTNKQTKNSCTEHRSSCHCWWE